VLQALVGHVAREEATVFFSSHQLSEVEQIADHIAIIDRGQTIVAGALDDLRAHYQRIQLVFDGDAPEIRVHAAGTHRVRRQGRVITIVSGPPKGGSSLGNSVVDEVRGYRPLSIDVSPITLKEIFLESVRTED
jgi:ABC-2 type transport system ATP-binding protein